MGTNYPERNSGHKNSFEVGSEFADFVCIELAKQGIILQNINTKKFQYETGENLQGFEIKYDSRHTGTGRLSIEIAEKTKGENLNWVDSGIFRGDNSWLYIQGNNDMFFIFAISMLRGLYRTGRYEIAEWPKEYPTVKKYYLPHDDAIKYCARVFKF